MLPIAASGIFIGTALTTTAVATGLGVGALRSKKISDLIYNTNRSDAVEAATDAFWELRALQ